MSVKFNTDDNYKHTARDQHKDAVALSVEHESSTGYEDFDDDFDKLTSGIDFEEPDPDEHLPTDIDIKKCLDEFVVSPPVTDKQMKVNEVLKDVTSAQVKQFRVFCTREFEMIADLYKSPQVLNGFYRSCHVHQTGDQYKINVMLCFLDTAVLSDAHWFICYKLVTAIREHIINGKAADLQRCHRHLPQREQTSAAKGRIRYVVGFCVNKMRKEHLRVVQKNMYSTTPTGQSKYKESKTMLNILDTSREEETFISNTTIDPITLYDTSRRQNMNKGLTLITYDMYMFFFS